MVEAIEIGVAIALVTLLSRYISWVFEIVEIVLPSSIFKIMTLVIAISVIQYIISRKDD